MGNSLMEGEQDCSGIVPNMYQAIDELQTHPLQIAIPVFSLSIEVKKARAYRIRGRVCNLG